MPLQRLFRTAVRPSPLTQQTLATTNVKLSRRSTHPEQSPSTQPVLNPIVTITVPWSQESMKARSTDRTALTPPIYADFCKASKPENLLTYTEDGQTHVTNNPEVVMSQLQKDRDWERRVVKLEQSYVELKQRHVELEQRHEELEQSNVELKQRHVELEQSHVELEQNTVKLKPSTAKVEQSTVKLKQSTV